ncbi:MAG: carbohydrate binding family 9 domain-containing protein [Flavobacteriales bacterium]|nr:carbohydrate binding family 9 domain-containing protein [Flavobacteriales bacterium]
MRYYLLVLYFLASAVIVRGDNDKAPQKVITFTRTEGHIKIDGQMDEDAWKEAIPISDFIQYSPYHGKPPSQQTEVRVLYSDQALYVGAHLFDTAPDSILTELGKRDDDELNADYFIMGIDPYNNHQDGYLFSVSASGVQVDSRATDETYNAVWESEVSIDEKGWTVEVKIPYSAIRFPSAEVQNWSIQFGRKLQRHVEASLWANVPQDAANEQNYWGVTAGIKNIQAPARLSMTPYVSAYVITQPYTRADGTTSKVNSFSYNAGSDLKYGIDDRFTLDVTLLPDFGQVQSDQKVKNLGYNEVTYNENRPFFNEGTELFNHNNLFYSRRIGQIKKKASSLELSDGEEITDFPQQARLINATKLSGRTDGGLGLGFLNALTNHTYATIQDTLGNERQELLSPLTNFNVLTVDKQFGKSNNNAYLTNTDVLRAGDYSRSNVTGAGFNLYSKGQVFTAWGDGAFTQNWSQPDSTGQRTFTPGYKYSIGVRKASGILRYGISHEAINKNYDATDMGFFTITQVSRQSGWIQFYRFQPWKFLRDAFAGMDVSYGRHPVTHKATDGNITLHGNATLKNLWHFYLNVGTNPNLHYDYYEAREEGKPYARPPFTWTSMGFSTDSRKKYAVETGAFLGYFLGEYLQPNRHGNGFTLAQRYRVNNHLTVIYIYDLNTDHYRLGYADKWGTDTTLFSGNHISTITHSMEVRLPITHTMSISLVARHYWSRGYAKDFYTLNEDGSLTPLKYQSQDYDFNYNAFNIDGVFTWWFAPGSTLTLAYKNALETEQNLTYPGFSENMRTISREPHANSLSVKAIYYLDYLYLRRRKA